MLTDTERHDLFPVTRELAYLNHTFRGPTCRPAAQAAKAWIDELSIHGVFHYEHWWRKLLTVRDRFARFIGAQPGELCFLGNATEAFVRVALGIDWRLGDQVVVPANDYPGLTRPLWDLRRLGVEVVLVPIREDQSLPVEDLLAAVTQRTRLVAASHVNFWSGWRLDIDRLCGECRALGVLTAIDMVQSAGALAIDVAKTGCDFATFCTRKWLLGVDDAGILYVRRESMEQLRPLSVGTPSVASPYEYFRLDQPLAKDATRYQLGAVSGVACHALGGALEVFERFSPAAIEACVLDLAEKARGMAMERGFAPWCAHWQRENLSGAISLPRTGLLADNRLEERLFSAKVSAGVRPGILRISPHFYNSAPDLEHLFDALSGTQ